MAYPVLLAMFTLLRPTSPADKESPISASRQRYIPAQLLPPDVDPRSALVDPSGAIFHATLLLVTLGTLVGTSFVEGVEVWMVTMPAGLIAFFRDVWSERKSPNVARKEHAEESEVELEEVRAGNKSVTGDAPTPVTALAAPPTEGTADDSGRTSTATLTAPQNARPTRRYSLPALVRATCRRFPTTTSTISRLPLTLLTFAGGIFILARGLTMTGWTDTFAGWLVKICVNPAATVFFVGCVAK